MNNQEEVTKDTNQKNTVHAETYFPSLAYYIENLDFLEDLLAASNDALEKVKADESSKSDLLREIYPIYQTDQLFSDNRTREFHQFVVNTAWDILKDQGFDMDNAATFLQELWCQEHYKHSGHEEHIHGYGSQLVGFYFLETPENCSSLVFHDPRPAKRQINLREEKISEITMASSMVHITPTKGLLVFANSWLPHSISRNGSNNPMKFIHFTVGVQHGIETIKGEIEKTSNTNNAEVI